MAQLYYLKPLTIQDHLHYRAVLIFYNIVQISYQNYNSESKDQDIDILCRIEKGKTFGELYPIYKFANRSSIKYRYDKVKEFIIENFIPKEISNANWVIRVYLEVDKIFHETDPELYKKMKENPDLIEKSFKKFIKEKPNFLNNHKKNS